ncbi:MAG: hypothetical protein CL920_34970 [Deltaproteobacteria bacterium]|nr:hypothetical protein [Deltaproteobacteria bacterium]|tara:strand:+ start:1473 stop:2693 length:1221 start_codon:yes stop_codon:yes gene_type:complete
MLLNVMVIVIVCSFGFLLLTPKVRNAKAWQATVTPLASIIGSGFLVALPLLGHELGPLAVFGMFSIVLIAYLVGGILRFNIRVAEPLLKEKSVPTSLRSAERMADFFLMFAYVISITFYIRLLVDFVLKGSGLTGSPFYARIAATAILCMIGMVGFGWGLHGLEKLEEFAVSVKLAIIAGLIGGLLHYNVQFLTTGQALTFNHHYQSWWHTIRVLAGMLIVVQGFETSRYLGDEYDAELRAKTMGWAQLISGAIYILFVGLATVLLPYMPSKVSDTAVIGLAAHVAMVLSPLLIIAAVASQFSAAVADTVGCGGLAVEMSGRRLQSRQSYIFIVCFAVVLTWFANIFQVIALASRAFALYYLFETVIAWLAAGRTLEGKEKWLMKTKILIAGSVLLFVVIFGVSAE